MLIILDRDGVINEDSDDYIKSPDEWHPINGSLEAIAKLNKAGFKVVVATNQSGVARGLFSKTTLHAIHQKMEDEIEKVGGHLEGIYICMHHPNDDCDCRKPKTGLLEKIKEDFADEFNSSVFIGDSFKDIEVARKMNCTPALVLTGKGERTLKEHLELKKDIHVFKNLSDAVNFILSNS